MNNMAIRTVLRRSAAFAIHMSLSLLSESYPVIVNSVFLKIERSSLSLNVKEIGTVGNTSLYVKFYIFLYIPNKQMLISKFGCNAVKAF
jgi:hypothetical protein